MSDTYKNFKELSAVENNESDYLLSYKVRTSNILFFTPHGGGIEPGCSELTIGSAGENFSYYVFEGHKLSGNHVLHITSTRFDEPNLLKILPLHDYVVSYHGYSDSNKANTKIGGLDDERKEGCLKALIEANFSAEIVPPGEPLNGLHPNNVTNKGISGKGLQLEISTLQRSLMFGINTATRRKSTQNEIFRRYVKAILSCLPSD
ncbi:poly-gamma-glutamate hydrolase family protein [Bacillus sp. FJAT-50079]|uniref:poly-gamma-glutamate hydrolase family protein n=1 Tax=Bacillus sp. FJAT-50079 TaxID=2833577 RepID=UPI001BC90C6A|nr:poly-gamma-glutamate hydrolase family protein [Bacillus sp. FJAT-50079]MBS4206725.1 poly-gamma-glutamate hydrolase family protein [Bacillus sp. FJAT-50079]